MDRKLDSCDLKSLFALRDILESLDPAGPPKARLIEGQPGAAAAFKRIGVLSGSFNPPTLAHVELGARAREVFGLDRVVFTLSRVTVDKPELEGLFLEDRLLLLSLVAREVGWASVAATNRGLYCEQASAMRSLFGKEPRLYFIVGMDKVRQIFDPVYYEEREKALLALFTEAQLIAAGRGGSAREELEGLLAEERNQGFQDRVYFLRMPDETTMISSSAVRAAIERGGPAPGQVPQIVEEFIKETGAYGPRYDVRRSLLERLYPVREWAEGNVDLRGLIAMAAEEQKGSRLRSLLESKVSPNELKDLISALVRS